MRKQREQRHAQTNSLLWGTLLLFKKGVNKCDVCCIEIMKMLSSGARECGCKYADMVKLLWWQFHPLYNFCSSFEIQCCSISPMRLSQSTTTSPAASLKHNPTCATFHTDIQQHARASHVLSAPLDIGIDTGKSIPSLDYKVQHQQQGYTHNFSRTTSC